MLKGGGPDLRQYDDIRKNAFKLYIGVRQWPV